jgi:hypothetical protein
VDISNVEELWVKNGTNYFQHTLDLTDQFWHAGISRDTLEDEYGSAAAFTGGDNCFHIRSKFAPGLPPFEQNVKGHELLIRGPGNLGYRHLAEVADDISSLANSFQCTGNACDDILFQFVDNCYVTTNHGPKRVKVTLGPWSYLQQAMESHKWLGFNGSCFTVYPGTETANYQ